MHGDLELNWVIDWPVAYLLLVLEIGGGAASRWCVFDGIAEQMGSRGVYLVQERAPGTRKQRSRGQSRPIPSKPAPIPRYIWCPC